MMNTDIGDRMKEYELREAGRHFMPLVPILVRIDGRNFSKWTKGLKTPYDTGLSELMVKTTHYLVEESHALVGYTQSDEISLLFYSDDYKSQVFFNGRVQKLTSVLASMTTAYFNAFVPDLVPSKAEAGFAHFDCRVWTVPDKHEAANAFLWREMDATKNSIQLLGRAHFSHKELMNKSGREIQDMLITQKGINWNNEPDFFKRGTFVRRCVLERPFTAMELESLPEQHHARQNPDLVVKRSLIKTGSLPPLLKVANRVDVLFDGANPIQFDE